MHTGVRDNRLKSGLDNPIEQGQKQAIFKPPNGTMFFQKITMNGRLKMILTATKVTEPMNNIFAPVTDKCPIAGIYTREAFSFIE